MVLSVSSVRQADTNIVIWIIQLVPKTNKYRKAITKLLTERNTNEIRYLKYIFGLVGIFYPQKSGALLSGRKDANWIILCYITQKYSDMNKLLRKIIQRNAT